jgi:hypothetical protein
MDDHPASIASTRMKAIIGFVASVLICSFACNLSADTPKIRVSIEAQRHNANDAQMISALSHEFRKLDGVSVSDTPPALKVSCLVVDTICGDGSGYAASVAVSINGIFDQHFVLTNTTIDSLAHAIAIAVDGSIIEGLRRIAQPSSSP